MADSEVDTTPQVADSEVDTTQQGTSQTAPEPPAIRTTQWLSVISIIVSLAGIYYKREEIKGVFTKPPPSPVLPRAPQPSPRGGIRMMD